MINFAIILAGGKSKRMKRIEKIFFKIKGKPLIWYTLKIFENHPQIHKIVLVSRKSNFNKVFNLIKKYKIHKIAKVVKEGRTRQDSAFNGLKYLEELGAKPKDLVLFHNGCNPLVSALEISKVIRAAKIYGAALVGQPCKDTLKRVNKNRLVSATIDRSNIYLAQTPQVIEYSLAKKGFKKAFSKNFQGTDDISLIERLGKKIKMVPCSYQNLKVTIKEDLEIIKDLL